MTDPKTLDAEELRAWAAEAVVVPRYFTFDADGLRFLADMIEIADVNARAAIECNLLYEDGPGGRWYDTTRVDDEDCAMIDQALGYLEARGRLTRKPGAPHWIRPWVEVRP